MTIYTANDNVFLPGMIISAKIDSRTYGLYTNLSSFFLRIELCFSAMNNITPPFSASVGVEKGLLYPWMFMSKSGTCDFLILVSDIPITSILKSRRLRTVSSSSLCFFRDAILR